MRRRKQILIIGSNEEHCSENAYQLAYQLGVEAAKRGVVVLTGGLGGVMEAACKGAQAGGGLSIGIIPYEDLDKANRYCEVVIATGMGLARDFITAYSCDAVIVVEGGVGTAIEAYTAYLKAKPIIAMVTSGGTAAKLAAEQYLDDRRRTKVHGAQTPGEAIEAALRFSESPG